MPPLRCKSSMWTSGRLGVLDASEMPPARELHDAALGRELGRRHVDRRPLALIVLVEDVLHRVLGRVRHGVAELLDLVVRVVDAGIDLLDADDLDTFLCDGIEEAVLDLDKELDFEGNPCASEQDVLKALVTRGVALEKFEIAMPSLNEIFIRAVSEGAPDA